MKVLWFEISTPAKYRDTGNVVLGWQDSLENIVRGIKDVDLYIAFESLLDEKEKVVDGVTYIPMFTHYSFGERKRADYTWKVNECKVIAKALEVVERVKPDIIHVFGNEWPFGLIASKTSIPVVVHIQGSIIPYNNALYPPKYNGYTEISYIGCNLRKQLQYVKKTMKVASRLEMEKRIWQCVRHYMGRTCWDKALVNMLHPSATYYHVEEALRPVFMNTKKRWQMPTNKKIKIFTTGCSSLWKGIDVMLKTAHILKQINIDFEWKVAGNIGTDLKKMVEKKEKLIFDDNCIEVLGFTKSSDVVELLCESTMYVHTAYIENSPNSICEAQVLGVPVVSTMVGGISTLVRNGIDGDLVPANDPWQMADAIVRLANDRERMQRYSESSMEYSRKRHAQENILKQLLNCYKEITKKYI